jgi:hypothetical protein
MALTESLGGLPEAPHEISVGKLQIDSVKASLADMMEYTDRVPDDIPKDKYNGPDLDNASVEEFDFPPEDYSDLSNSSIASHALDKVQQGRGVDIYNGPNQYFRGKSWNQIADEEGVGTDPL